MNDPGKVIAAFIESLNGDSHKIWLYKADSLLSFYFRQKDTAYTAEDIISGIIAKTIDEGGRNWDMDKIPLDAYMMKTIESEVWNISRKGIQIETVDFNDTGMNSCSLEAINRHSLKQEDTDRDNDFRELYEACLDALSGDAECLQVFEELRKGATAVQIGKTLGMDSNKILSVKQKIRRALRRKIFYNNT